MARPYKTNSKKDPKTIEKFLQRISEGRSQSSVCRDEDMPDWKTIWNWTKSDSLFASQYREAKEQRGNYYGEKVAEIAMAVLSGKLTDSNSARVAIDGLKWASARMAYKDFGDKMQVDHGATSSYLDALKEVSLSLEGGKDSKLSPDLRTHERNKKQLTIQ